MLLGKIAGDSSNIRNSLYRAALEGDWQSANSQYKEYRDAAKGELPQEMDAPTLWELPITQQKLNALQVAIAAKQANFVKKLLNCMTAKELEFKNDNGDTALAITALSGSVEIAKKIVEENNELLMDRNNQETLPLITAAMHRQRDMVSYLYSVTEFHRLNPDERIKLLVLVISCDLYGMSYVSLTVS